MGENHHPASENRSHVYPPTSAPTVPVSSRSERGAAQTPSGQSDPDVRPASPPQPHDDQIHESEPPTHAPTAIRRNAEEASTRSEEAAVPEDEGSTLRLSEEDKSDGENRTGVSEASDQLPAPSEGPEPEDTEQTHPHPNMVEPLSDHRRNREYI